MDDVSLLTAIAAAGACLMLGAILGFAGAAWCWMNDQFAGDDEYERGFEDGLARSYAPLPADVRGDIPNIGGLHG